MNWNETSLSGNKGLVYELVYILVQFLNELSKYCLKY